MKIVKCLISVLLLVPYIVTFGMISISVTFPDGTSICYDGWLM